MTAQIELLVSRGIAEALEGSVMSARATFHKVLEFDPNNEEILMWLAYLAESPYEAADILGELVKKNPFNLRAQRELDKNRQRIVEIELLATSATFRTRTAKEGYLNDKDHYAVDFGSENYRKIEADEIETPHFLGELCLSRKLIKPEDLGIALSQQRDCISKGKWKSLGKLLVEMGFLTPVQLQAILNLQRDITLNFLGSVLMRRGLITEVQLSKALFYQQEMAYRGKLLLLGQALMELKFVTPEKLEQELKQFYTSRNQSLDPETLLASSVILNNYKVEKENHPVSYYPAQDLKEIPKIGEYLYIKGYINQEQLLDALSKQRNCKTGKNQPLGQLMVNLGYITKYQLETVVEQSKADYGYSFFD